ncbi:MAG: KEOPS complex kinase/ATPase Bud32 [Nanoarchaeota archaeon]|nr:Kae1-associated serine/threonine protein kinase [Nanoarchaeota archaeon]MBU1631683.1 Kae1-associated serine/threonine protein kinase [Nanoarchaeota archaeon]MBU1876255.1 Kae1-associated serine/threonine protein kinase [Nanoarchaeota archaeon]
MIKIAQGAEAILYKDNNEIIKERFSKEYRLPHLDESLRKFRTRREAKVLQKLEEMDFPAPKLKEFSDKRMSVVMDFIPGEKLKDVLKEGKGFQQLAEEIGERVGKLHQKHIIHGDLTTSNMIQHQETGKINIIDFGLSFFSEKIEDKAVDLFLLDRALESTHYDIYPDIFKSAIEGYKKSNPEEFKKILERFEEVRNRGRNKRK